jgi:hypothetical protein
VAFDPTLFPAILDALVSHAASSGYFDRVNAHEPKNAPGGGVTCSVVIGQLLPGRAQSGLATTTMVFTPKIRVQARADREPLDQLDTDLMTAAGVLFVAYCGDFTLDGLVRNVDIFGANGMPLSCQPGYLEQDKVLYRVAEMIVPLVINDVFDQAP